MSDLLALKYTVGDRDGRARAEAWAEQTLARAAWRQHVNRRGLKLLARHEGPDVAPILLPADGGVICGVLFDRQRGQAKRVDTIGADTFRQWCATGMAALIERFWGPYLAVLCDLERDRVLILRDPIGARAAFLAQVQGVRVLFTNLADWAALCDIEIDQDYLRLFLAYPRLCSARTGLKGVSELMPGQVLAWERTSTATTIGWKPAPPRRGETISGFEAAARALRQGAEACATAWASANLPVIHRLSGGFDSSTALACLVAGGVPDLVCINERPMGVPEGDEYEAAERTARHFGVPIEAIQCDARAADYSKLIAAPAAPRPSLADLSFADASVLVALDARDDLCVLTSGQGGDQVFSRRPILNGLADGVRDGRLPRELLCIALDEARLSGKPISHILLQGWLGLTQSQASALERAMSVAGEAPSAARAHALREALAHCWIDGIDHRGPARALRALNLIDLNFYQRPTILSERSLAAPIFAMQPMVETVVRIPPYLMQAGGRDRALARAAFADLLPEHVLARTRKGDTTRHFVRALGANRKYLGDLFAKGELARRGLVSPAQLALDLEKLEGLSLFRVLTALVAESWLQRIASMAHRKAERPPAS